MAPVGGLVYYISPPESMYHMVANPLHTLSYITFVLSACALFASVCSSRSVMSSARA